MIKLAMMIFILLTVADTIISFMPQVRSQVWASNVHRMVEFPQRPIRKILPPDMPIDVSPIVIILLLKLLMAVG
jgi:uncharacterized protein YggT (Ycf19 family)